VFHPTCRRHDIKTTSAVFCLSSSWSTAQSANGRSQLPAPTCGTTFRSTSYLHSHSRSSDSVSRLSSFLVPTRTSWYDLYLLLLVIIIVFLLSGISREPCNNWYYLGHVKHVDDDDDDGDDDRAIVTGRRIGNRNQAFEWYIPVSMILSDLEWLSEIFSDTKHRAISLRQPSFLLYKVNALIASQTVCTVCIPTAYTRGYTHTGITLRHAGLLTTIRIDLTFDCMALFCWQSLLQCYLPWTLTVNLVHSCVDLAVISPNTLQGYVKRQATKCAA